MPSQLVYITVPDIAGMSDEEIAEFASRFDGRWSEQTKLLLSQFNTGSLDLNVWWAATWTSWACPCCKREKQQIARLTNNNVLRCKLESHHDHLSDRARRIFDDLNPGVHGEVTFNRQRNVVKDAIISLVERFERTLVCADCNAAEGTAKRKLIDVDRYFTFSPEEIGRFVCVGPNRAHEVDLKLASEIWLAAEADFIDRIDFTRRMAQRFQNGRNRRQFPHAGHTLPFDDRHFLWEQVVNAVPNLLESRLSAQLVARSISDDGAGIFVQTKPGFQSPPPTDAEFASIVNRLSVGKKTWLSVGEQWTCGCCKRSKREICRKSNKGEWTARIHRIRDWIFEENASSLEWRKRYAESPLIVGTHRSLYVCQDCRNIPTKVQALCEGVNEHCLTIGDLAEVIVSIKPNRDHDVSYEEASHHAEANRNLMAAAAEYDQHWRRCWDLRSRFESLTKFAHYTRQEAISHFAQEYVDDQFGLPEAIPYLEWSLKEGERFANLHKQEKLRAD